MKVWGSLENSRRRVPIHQYETMWKTTILLLDKYLDFLDHTDQKRNAKRWLQKVVDGLMARELTQAQDMGK